MYMYLDPVLKTNAGVLFLLYFFFNVAYFAVIYHIWELSGQGL